MSEPITGALLAVVLLVGLLIGVVGVGGVLLVPALVHVGGMAIHAAIATAMAAYFFAGTAGTIAFSRRGSIRWSDALRLMTGAIPGAFIGAAAAAAVPALALELLIATFIIASALHSLCGKVPVGGGPRAPAKGALFVIGAVTGIGSSMSGTGGPLVLIPILLWLRVPVPAAVGLGHAISIPISAFATAGNVVYGAIDFMVAAPISVLLTIGVWFGARMTQRVSNPAMKGFVSAALLAVGVAMLVRLALPATGGAGT